MSTGLSLCLSARKKPGLAANVTAIYKSDFQSATSPIFGMIGDQRQMIYDDEINGSGDSPTVTYGAFDYLKRLRSVTSVPSGVGQSVLGYGYVYNDANQRVEQQLPDDSAWGYGYDSLGQLSSAKRRWTDQSPVEGQQFECGYDTIGNGKTVKAGGVPTTAALVCSGSKMLSLIMLLRLGCGFAIGTQPPK